MPDRAFAPDRGQPTRFIEPDLDSGTSAAVIVRPGETLAHTALMRPVDQSGKIVDHGQAAAQADRVLSNLNWALSAAGTGRERTVKMTVYVASEAVLPAVRDSVAQAFPGRIRPAVSWIINRQPDPAILVTMDAVAVAPSAHEIGYYRSDLLPSWYGAAHVSIMPPGRVFHLSGQAAVGATPGEAATNTVRELDRTLMHFGLGVHHTVRLRLFISSMSYASTVIRAIAAHFGESRCPPIVITESCTEPSRPIEIEMVAVDPGSHRNPIGAPQLDPTMRAAPQGFSRVAIANTDSHGLTYFSGIAPPSNLAPQLQFAWAYDRLRSIGGRSEIKLTQLIRGTHFLRELSNVEMLQKYLSDHVSLENPAAASFVLARGGANPGTSYTLDMIGFSSMQSENP